MRRAVAAAAVLAAVAGCGGGSSAPAQSSDASVCADALDAADAGFTALAGNVRRVQTALDQAFAGNLAAAHSTLASVHLADPSTYKRLEAECRAAVGR